MNAEPADTHIEAWLQSEAACVGLRRMTRPWLAGAQHGALTKESWLADPKVLADPVDPGDLLGRSGLVGRWVHKFLAASGSAVSR
jgi:hypothetical protein